MPKKIAHIDKIYFINMDRSIDRLKNMQTQCKAANIECIRFPAVNGYNVLIQDNTGKTLLGSDIKKAHSPLPPQQKFKITCNPGSNSPTTYNIIGDATISSGQLGGWCSFIEVMKDAKRSNYKNILIFEDDVKIQDPTNFVNKVNNFLSYVPETFDFAFLGLNNHKNSLQPILENDVVSLLKNNVLGYGMHSFITNKKGIDKFLSYNLYDSTAPDAFIWKNTDSLNSDDTVTGGYFESYVSSKYLVDQNFNLESLLIEMGRNY